MADKRMDKHSILLVVTMSYDGDIPVYLFDRHDTYKKNFDEAALYMKKMYENFLDEERRESVAGLNEEGCFIDMEEGYACIQWNDGDKEEMQITYPSEPIECYKSDAENPGYFSCIVHLSNVHITPESVDFLSEPRDADAFRVIPCNKGCLIEVHNYGKCQTCGLPVCVAECIKYANEHGCSWLHIGPEGPEHKCLTTYRKAWECI